LLRTLEHGAAVSAIAFTDSDAGHAMASGALDGAVRVVREDGSTLALQASGGVEAVALLPDGRVLVADAERRLDVYAADGTLLAALELPERVMSLRREDTRLVALANCLANTARRSRSTSSAVASSRGSKATSAACFRHAGCREIASSRPTQAGRPGCGTDRRDGSSRPTGAARSSSPTRRSCPAWSWAAARTACCGSGTPRAVPGCGRSQRTSPR
jgi:hypothetical protein